MTRGDQRDRDRARAQARAKASTKGGASQIEANNKAMTVLCSQCRQPFMCTVNNKVLEQHVSAKHPKHTVKDCFPDKAT
uniref:Uncharacterized protein n=1 Tax=Chromera velia CCMP2878 TaxID=1169474 RepID=A0A0G4HNR5_9ALVE|eukprot:Cvel_7669.t1-p1 / transcript=Cvel_7669.t1 / gene=Cvel_7669 / organism=Chromera_velia_CCMP2878 / gene_product=Uncharacterized protein At2g23090, putative / transcript_product=Uncharacterized protein At2g23090, putative / location=Cvel_scaffold406:88973-89893(+) / protein_length=78 / sequence_SO=supercontig / SO=protein_coding / is_pseudo=false